MAPGPPPIVGNVTTYGEFFSPGPNFNWDQLLTADNRAGRIWLQRQIGIATPLLSESERAQVQAALSQPKFPETLAKMIAKKATEASQGNQTIAPLSYTSIQTICGNATWSNCGVVVKQALGERPGDLQKIVDIAIAWGKKYEDQYTYLRKKGRLEKVTPEAEKIAEAITAKLNPIEIAKDHTKDKILKHCLGKLAFLVEWAKTPLGVAVQAFFKSADVATDYDELQLMNGILQDEIAHQLSPYLKPAWQTTIIQVVTESAPQWRSP
jgi:hypothetical protein